MRFQGEPVLSRQTHSSLRLVYISTFTGILFQLGWISLADNIVFGLSVTPENLEWILSVGIVLFLLGHLINFSGDLNTLYGWDFGGNKTAEQRLFDSGSTTKLERVYQIFDSINSRSNDELVLDKYLKGEVSELLGLMRDFKSSQLRFLSFVWVYFWILSLGLPVALFLIYMALAFCYG